VAKLYLEQGSRGRMFRYDSATSIAAGTLLSAANHMRTCSSTPPQFRPLQLCDLTRSHHSDAPCYGSCLHTTRCMHTVLASCTTAAAYSQVARMGQHIVRPLPVTAPQSHTGSCQGACHTCSNKQGGAHTLSPHPATEVCRAAPVFEPARLLLHYLCIVLRMPACR
jgi:hypothetical protein